MRSVAKDEKSTLAQRIAPTALLPTGAGRSERGSSGMHAFPRMHVTILGAALCAVCAFEKGSDRSREQPWPAAACAEERKLNRKSSLADPAVLHPFWRRRFDALFQDAQPDVIDELNRQMDEKGDMTEGAGMRAYVRALVAVITVGLWSRSRLRLRLRLRRVVSCLVVVGIRRQRERTGR